MCYRREYKKLPHVTLSPTIADGRAFIAAGAQTISRAGYPEPSNALEGFYVMNAGVGRSEAVNWRKFVISACGNSTTGGEKDFAVP